MKSAEAPSAEFDRLLLSKNVPHIHEGIFFSLDYESFVACRKVSRKWSELLSTEPFQRRETELKRAWTDESRGAIQYSPENCSKNCPQKCPEKAFKKCS